MAAASSSLFLDTGYLQCNVVVHPVVIFNILEHHSRRKVEEANSRAVGTLLGTTTGNVVEVYDCFPVPHTEEEAVEIFKDFHLAMLELHKRVSPKRTVVGWYATGREVTETSVMIHDFYWQQMNAAPIHITVDTELRPNEPLAVKAYVSAALRFDTKQLLTYFYPISLEIRATEPEKVSLSSFAKAKESDEPSDMQDLTAVQGSLGSLIQKLDSVIAYVDEVKSGRREGDTRVGKMLVEALRKLPHHTPASLENSFAESTQELLMVLYLSSLTRAQMVLSDKIMMATQHLQPPTPLPPAVPPTPTARSSTPSHGL
ncbi:Mov34/MPN/PAD-1 family protein [Pelomyxa schiedti]|nr:Mov34/MPN/PAD-1 family protein [Pelomyxa schiedti]